MIRPKWPRRATFRQWRGLSSKPPPRRAKGSGGGHKAPKRSPRSEWPLLKRREPAPTRRSLLFDDESDQALAMALQNVASTKEEFSAKRGVSRGLGRTDVDWTALANDANKIKAAEGRERQKRGPKNKVKDTQDRAEEDPAADESSSKKNMLLVRGVSDNLTASDFYRLAPSSLSSWESSIKKVQQQRDPNTLEPLGCYQVSFSTASAAASYLLNLTRLQRLARHKLSSGSGLWQASAPAHLVTSPDPDVIARDLDRLTIASPSQENLPVTRARTSLRYPWSSRLSKLVEPLGYGPRPPVVLVDVSPGGLAAEDLAHFIRQDGWERDLAWKVSEPLSMDKDKAKNRFVIACETEWEARRFHRRWNQQLVTRSEEDVTMYRHVVSVSMVNW